ncbi:MAG TPA: prepilin peptidase [Vicinamibacterales bacterium]|jgi:leader peptidase (prepilin peptidase)/N-methyltransferase
MTPLQTPVLILGLAVVGLCVGSFLNVCIHRLPLKQSVVTPRSRCPHCGYALTWRDNLPVVSYALLGGRCRSCQAPIALRYPLVETITCAVFVWHGLVFGADPLLAIRLPFACALIVLFAIDLEHQILPDRITLPGIVVGFASSLFLPPGPLMSLAGMVVGGGILWVIAEAWFRLRKIEAMGFGDVKMLAMVGAVLGLRLVLLTFILSTMIGGVVAVALIATRRANMATAVPFGTMLAAAALAASLYGDVILAWYLAKL